MTRRIKKRKMHEKCSRLVANMAIQIKKLLDKYMVGQEPYKQLLSMIISKHILTGKTASCLIIGPTGSGKTMPFEILRRSKLIPKDYVILTVNVSRLTEEGVVGPSLKDILDEFMSLCQMKGNSKCKGIIHIDEIDKIVYPDTVISGGNEKNRNNAVQHQIMQLLDGGTVEGVPLNDILFVFTGAFSKLDEKEEKEDHIGTIGFLPAENKASDPCRKNISIRDQLLDIGFQREFLGRINHVIRLNELSRNELKAILMHPQNGEIAKIKKEYRDDGIDVDINMGAIDEIVNRIQEEKLGARSVRNIMSSLLEGVWFKCIENGYDHVTIDKNTVLNGIVTYDKTKSSKEKIAYN